MKNPVTTTVISDEQMKEARGWLRDCDDRNRPVMLSNEDVRRRITREYDGGWPAFLRDTAVLAAA